MALIRWEPFAELSVIQSEMNRLFNNFTDQPAGHGFVGRRWVPPMDLVESEDHYTLRADLPGMTEADLDIQMQDNVLTISGERRPEHGQTPEGYFRLERAFGTFSRSLTLPEGVNPDAVNAHFDRGVLEVTILKPEQKKPRRVAITVGATDEPYSIEGAQTTDTFADDRELAGVAG